MPEYFLTYAQNAEDVMLWRALKHVERGFYIDVGAQDPITDSVTKAFSEHGWNGVNIEPVQHWHERLVVDRPHDVNLRIAASNRAGEVTLFEVEDTGLSTADSEFARRHREQGWKVREVTVPCRTLDDICEEHGVKTVHFLKIDCEGAEKQVLEGFSLEAVRPWIILAEATEPLSAKPNYKKWEYLLVERGYKFVYFDGLNRFYLADEHLNLRKAFSVPPNPMDWAFRAVQARAEEQIKDLTSRLTQLTAAERSTLAEAECAHLRSESGRLQVELERVSGEKQSALALVQERDSRIAELMEERERSVGEGMRLSVELERVRAEGQSALESVQMRGAQNVVLAAEHGRFQADLERARAVRQGLQKAVREEKAHADTLRAQLDALYRSRSWRVTAPLRVAGRTARWLLRALFRLLVFVMRPFARLARPVLRRMARSLWLRRVATRVLGQHSLVTNTGRLFLFGVVGSGTEGQRETQDDARRVPVRDLGAGVFAPESPVTDNPSLRGAGLAAEPHRAETSNKGEPLSDHERIVQLILAGDHVERIRE